MTRVCGFQTTKRRLAESLGTVPASKLAPDCEALVRLAEPGDVYAHYNTAMSAAAVSTQIKSIEQRLGLKVCILLAVMTSLAPAFQAPRISSSEALLGMH